MSVRAFLKYVEIQTKLASVIPFLLGSLYAVYKFETFNPVNAVLMFFSLLLFDMTTTAINNYMDYRTAIKREGYGFEQHNSIIKYKLNPVIARNTVFVLLSAAIALGFVLFLRTSIFVLLLGVLSFAIGVSYTFGPLPISRTPFGEAFSGLTMGLLIPFLSVYIHVWDKHLLLSHFSGEFWTISLEFWEVLSVFLVSIPSVMSISNIMLANNICDMEEDLANKRTTLPLLVGEKKALLIFAASYVLGYLSVIMAVALKVLPPIYLISLVTSIPVFNNVRIFWNKHVKAETFILSVKSFVLVNLSAALLIGLGIFL